MCLGVSGEESAASARRHVVEPHLGILDAALDGVHVSILKSGQQHLAAQVRDRFRTDQTGRQAVGADVNDAAASHGDGAGPASHRVDGVHRAVSEDEIGRWLGPAGGDALRGAGDDEQRARESDPHGTACYHATP